MYLTPETRALYAKIPMILARIPDDVWVEFDETGIAFQGTSPEIVQARRALFPGLFWSKSYNAGCSWWEYHAVYEGVPIKVYACPKPPTCVAIEEVIEVEENVPVKYEKQLVRRTKVRWDCGKPTSAEQDAVSA